MSDPTIDSLRSSIMGHPVRVLIVRIGAMGDVLHAMPAVAGLRAAIPEAFIGWAIEPRWMPLLASESGEMPLVNRVHAVPTREWRHKMFSPATWQEIAALCEAMQAERYHVCIDLQGSVKSAVVGWMAGAGQVIGLDQPRESPARLLYDERVRVAEWSVIGQACELVSTAAGRTIIPETVKVPKDPDAERWADEVQQGQPFVLIAPTAGWGAKEWGAERFGELAADLRAAGWRVLVNTAAGSPPGIASRVGEISGAAVVPSTLAQMIALTRRAALVVGGDTGPVHLAAALGRPVVALFGPTDPERNGPKFVGARVNVLRDPSSTTSHKRSQETEAGLQRIRVEEVLASALAMLDANR